MCQPSIHRSGAAWVRYYVFGIETFLISVFHFIKTVSLFLQEKVNHDRFSNILGEFSEKHTLRQICFQKVYWVMSPR